MTNLLKKTSYFVPYGGSTIAISALTGLMSIFLFLFAFSLALPTTVEARVRCCEGDGCTSDSSCLLSIVDTGAPATAPTGPTRTALNNPLGTSNIEVLVSRAIKIFTGLSGSFALLMFVYGGFMWVTSAGNMDRVKKGKQVFVWAAIGLIVVFGSYAFRKTFIDALGG